MKKYPSNPAKVRAANIKAEMVRLRRSPGERLPFETDPWTRRLWRPLLIALLATALGVALLTLVTIGTPEVPWLLLIPLCFAVALEGAYTAAWLGNPESFGVDKAIYRITELIVIVLLARVVSWLLFVGGLPSVEELRLMMQSPTAFVLSGGFLTTALICLIVWWFASTISSLFNQLDVSRYELEYYTLSKADQKARADDQPIGRSRDQLQSGFLRFWLLGAFAIVVLTALSTFEVGEFATVSNPFDITRLGLQPSMLLALLVYFLLGLLLLSHGRLLRMNASWLMDGVAKEAAFERNWQRYTLFLLAAIAFAAAFLPIGSTFPIARALEYVLSGVGYLFNVINLLLSAVIASFLALLAGMMGNEETSPVPSFEPPDFQRAAAQAGENGDSLALVATSAFWALVVVGGVAATLYFLRERGLHVDRASLRTGWDQLRLLLAGWWVQLTGRARRVRQQLSRSLTINMPSRNNLGGLPSPPRWRFLRINALSPRDQVRYFYLSTVRRAEESGVERRQDETPLEYARDLKGRFPESEEDVEVLTQAFVRARYSKQSFETDDVNPIKARWKRFKARLRAVRRP